MGQSAEELRRDIERTRGDLGGTVDAIGDRVSPGRVVERRRNRMKDGLSSIRHRVMGSDDSDYGQHAYPYESAQGGQRTYGEGRSYGGSADEGGGLGDRLSGVGEGMSEMGHGMSDRANELSGAVRGAPDTARQQAQGNPLIAGAVAFGLGALAGVAFPGTRAEGRLTRTAMDRAQPLKDEARHIGQEMSSHLQESGQQAAEHLKEEATAGAEQVKQTAQDRAQDTKETGASAAQDVKGQAQGTAQDVKGQAQDTAQQVRNS